MKMEVIGDEALLRNIKKLGINVEKALVDTVTATVATIEEEAVDSLDTISRGRVEPRGKKFHTVSKPGDAPNTDTGELKGSIRIRQDGLKGYVYSPKEYGLLLETALNRPWLKPAMMKAKPLFKRLVEGAVKQQLRRAGK